MWDGQRLGLSLGPLSCPAVLGTAQKQQPSCPLGWAWEWVCSSLAWMLWEG